MLNKHILKTIDSVNSVDDFNEVLNRFKLSDAAIDIKNAAIRELKAKKSVFDLDKNFTPAKVMAEIKAGEADIDDIG